jgi:NAD(P)-dependent dehydrogenase (short-subunit alcohol dehydrogenase family)
MQWIVTGASRGLGLEFVRQLALRGDRVIGTVRREQELGLVEAAGGEPRLLDVAQAASRERFVAALEGRPVDALLNNAGVMGVARALSELDLDDMRRCFEVNSVSPLALTRDLLANLRAGDHKLLLSMTSRMGSIEDNSSGGAYAYRASKAALNAIHKSLSIDLGAEGFRCVVLHPGWVRTDMGGPSAPLGIAESVAGLLAVVDRLEPEDNGAFFDFSGERIPW